MPGEWLTVRAPRKPARAWLVAAGLLAGSLGLAWCTTRVSSDPAERLGWSIRFVPPPGWHRVSPLVGGEAVVAYGPEDEPDDSGTALHARMYLLAVNTDRAFDFNAVLRRFLDNVSLHYSARGVRALPVERCVVGAYEGREVSIGVEQALVVRAFFASPHDGYVVAMAASGASLEPTRLAFEALCGSVHAAKTDDAPVPHGTEDGEH